MRILLANPRGFCAGVDRAIDIVDRALELFGAPIYVRHEVVHNRMVVADLRKRGAVFVESIDDILPGSILIFSAHGVSQALRKQAKALKLKVFDATCPLVTKVHLEVARYSREGIECVLIGHKGHPEVEGTLGQYDNPEAGIYLIENAADVAKLSVKQPDNIVYVTQTTLSVDETHAIIGVLKARFPKIYGPKREDICYATQNRQDAVKQLAPLCDFLIVIGSANSSNSNRLSELAQKLGTESILLDDPKKLHQSQVQDKAVIGITAGASAPEVLVQAVIARLRGWGASSPEEISGIEENMVFSLPKALRQSETGTVVTE